ncbi:MAG: hypothetical protein RQ750_18155 [Roseovarius sp.]|nr:hypothetical protein [Roseovarius sp.]
MAEIAAADPEAQLAVLKARARQAGHSAADLSEMRRPAYGWQAGQAIYAVASGDRADSLWATYDAYRSAWERYAKVVLGLSRYSKTAKIEMMPDTVGTRADDQPDFRSEEEKAASASRAMQEWGDAMLRIGPHHRALIRGAARETVALMNDGQVTAQGRAFVAAVGALAKALGK